MSRRKAPTVMESDTTRADALLRVARPVREVSLPAPADGSWVNWRETEPWEFGLVVAARMRERRLELAMFDGLIG